MCWCRGAGASNRGKVSSNKVQRCRMEVQRQRCKDAEVQEVQRCRGAGGAGAKKAQRCRGAPDHAEVQMQRCRGGAVAEVVLLQRCCCRVPVVQRC